LSVEILNETETDIDPVEFSTLGRFILDALNVHPQSDLVISFVDSAAMAQLHERFLQLSGPTDVMSFPMDELRPGDGRKQPAPGILGDVVICPEVAAVQARQLGHSLVDEMLVLATHGILHLLGFDHADKEEETTMFELQKRLVLAFLANR
jgi:probable rRNA maturation factor